MLIVAAMLLLMLLMFLVVLRRLLLILLIFADVGVVISHVSYVWTNPAVAFHWFLVSTCSCGRIIIWPIEQWKKCHTYVSVSHYTARTQ